MLASTIRVFINATQGKINFEKLKQLARGVGLEMTDKEINEMIRVADSNGKLWI